MAVRIPSWRTSDAATQSLGLRLKKPVNTCRHGATPESKITGWNLFMRPVIRSVKSRACFRMLFRAGSIPPICENSCYGFRRRESARGVYSFLKIIWSFRLSVELQESDYLLGRQPAMTDSMLFLG